MENKVKNVLSGIGFYGTLTVCLLVIGVCGWLLLQDREDPAPQQAVTPQVPVSQPVEMPEVRLPAGGDPGTGAGAGSGPAQGDQRAAGGGGGSHACGGGSTPSGGGPTAGGCADGFFHGGAGIQSYFGRLAYPQRRGHRRSAGNHGTGGLRRGGAVGDGRSPDGHHRGAGA